MLKGMPSNEYFQKEKAPNRSCPLSTIPHLTISTITVINNK